VLPGSLTSRPFPAWRLIDRSGRADRSFLVAAPREE
jgi:hypothetical protein